MSSVPTPDPAVPAPAAPDVAKMADDVAKMADDVRTLARDLVVATDRLESLSQLLTKVDGTQSWVINRLHNLESRR